jgi:hypothetical protein
VLIVFGEGNIVLALETFDVKMKNFGRIIQQKQVKIQLFART